MFTHTLLIDLSWASLSELCLRGDNKLPASPVVSDCESGRCGLAVRSLRSFSLRPPIHLHHTKQVAVSIYAPFGTTLLQSLERQQESSLRKALHDNHIGKGDCAMSDGHPVLRMLGPHLTTIQQDTETILSAII